MISLLLSKWYSALEVGDYVNGRSEILTVIPSKRESSAIGSRLLERYFWGAAISWSCSWERDIFGGLVRDCLSFLVRDWYIGESWSRGLLSLFIWNKFSFWDILAFYLSPYFCFQQVP
jgi:hypothetical protein